jgi:hypothetical protein
MASPIVTNTSTQLNGASLVYGFTTALTDAQIKALPTTPVSVVAAPGSGLRIKILGATMRVNQAAGAYTNVNTTYAVIALTHTSAAGDWVAQGPVNDSSMAAGALTIATNFLNSTTPQFYDFTVPALFPYGKGAQSGLVGWNTSGNFAITDSANVAVFLSMDNNGSGVLTGGNASNSGAVTIYYAVEATA